MTKEEKQLLLIDLCARLPYGVIVKENDGVNENDNKLLDIDMFDRCINYDYIIEDIKPYLRPMSSMTENERKGLMEISEEYLDDWSTADSNLLKWKAVAKASSRRATFYNSHYLDCNDLIEKGLALVAPEGMYKTE